MWRKCEELFERYLPEAVVYNTICSATSERQKEAAELAKAADIMIIVGGLHSSNTHKLKAICDEYCKCWLVEDAEGLRACDIDLSGAKFIGISAGASTPAYIIKEVQQTMSEMLNNVDEEFNFEEELEKTLKKIHTGMKVEGIVTDINNGEVAVDIGTKHTGYIPASELTDDPTKKPEDIVKVGDKIDLIVLKTNDQEGIVTLSKKKVDAVLGFQKIVEAKEADATLTGTVTNVVKGGVLVSANGVKVFIPASQAAPRRDFDLNDLLKQSVSFKILEVNEAKQRAVGSIRAVAREERAAAQAKFFETAQIGSEVEGTVKSITDYGVFVDLGGVDGLIRRMDLSWNRIKHPSDVVSVGDKITVTIKDIDSETKKVSLTYKKASENPWEIFKANYEVGQVVKATVVSITSFGAFAQIIDGIDGLIHISELSWNHVNHPSEVVKVGQEVEVEVLDVDLNRERISLGLKQIEEDPWANINDLYKIGDVVSGKVTKITAFGAFVELSHKIDGLVHISQISKDRVEKVKDKLSLGQEIEARVIKIDRDERRIGLSIKALEEGFSEDDLKAAGEEVSAALKPGEALGDMGQLIGDSLDSLDVVRESKKD